MLCAASGKEKKNGGTLCAFWRLCCNLFVTIFQTESLIGECCQLMSSGILYLILLSNLKQVTFLALFIA